MHLILPENNALMYKKEQKQFVINENTYDDENVPFPLGRFEFLCIQRHLSWFVANSRIIDNGIIWISIIINNICPKKLK
jgi:hypothetical protein